MFTHKKFKRVSRNLALVEKFHHQALGTGPNFQSTKAQDIYGMVSVQFLEADAAAAISRLKHLTSFAVESWITTTLLNLITSSNLVPLLKLVTLLIQGRTTATGRVDLIWGQERTSGNTTINPTEQSGQCLLSDEFTSAGD